jgi:hypothetical protein
VTAHKYSAVIRVAEEDLADATQYRSWLTAALEASEAERVKRAAMTPTELAAYDAALDAHVEADREATVTPLKADWQRLHDTHPNPVVRAVLDLHKPGDWGYCTGDHGADGGLWEDCDTITAIRAVRSDPFGVVIPPDPPGDGPL